MQNLKTQYPGPRLACRGRRRGGPAAQSPLYDCQPECRSTLIIAALRLGAETGDKSLRFAAAERSVGRTKRF